MRRLLALLACTTILGAASVSAQDAPSPIGDWHGLINPEGQPVRTALHVEQAADGTFMGELDLPDRGLWDQPLDLVTYEDGVLAFTYRGGTRRFEGRWDPQASAWAGRFHTPGGSADLALRSGFLGMPVVAGLDGHWEGDLSQAPSARLILNVATDAHGTRALADLPHAVTVDIPVTELAREGDAVAFLVPALGLRFRGAIDATTGTLSGVIGAPGAEAPITFARNGVGGPTRPQTPAAPFPYEAEDVVLTPSADPDIRLGCTLLVPHGEGPHPAAVLLSGTGAQDRDETLARHRPFLILADHLARRGLATLRCDDRSAGASTGEFETASLADFAADAQAARVYLGGRTDIDPSRIGLIGHSEGAIVASMVAADHADTAFIVLIAGPGLPVHELLQQQGEAASRAAGLADGVIVQQSALRRAILEAARAADTPEAAVAAAQGILVVAGLPPVEARAQAEALVNPNILRILRTDPAEPLGRVEAPVLAILGGLDVQVPPAGNREALHAALADNPDATVVELPRLNHLLQTAETGAVAEYYDIEETMAPLALNTITGWLAELGLANEP